MTEQGKVFKIDAKGRATVKFPRKTACENCRMCLKPKNEMYVHVVIKNTLGAKVGDEVTVSMGNQAVLAASVIVYLMPLVLVALSLVFTNGLGDMVSFFVAIATLAVGFAIVALIDRFLRKNKKYIPEMQSIVSEDTENCRQIIEEPKESYPETERPDYK